MQTPADAKPNGYDRAPLEAPKAKPPVAAKTIFPKPSPAEVEAAEKQLLAAMAAHLVASVTELARITNRKVASTSERLKRLGERAQVEKVCGKWAPAESAARPTPPP